MRASFAGLLSFVCAATICVAARASSDPEIDEIIKAVEKIDPMTKVEFEKYKAALEKYADDRQKIFEGMRTLVANNEAEVDGKWDSLCDVGLKSLSDLLSSMPRLETNLKKFFTEEKAVWEALKRLEITQAEEAETRTRKMVETIEPAFNKQMQEILDADRKEDEEAKKAEENRKENNKNWLIIAGRVAVAVGGTAINAPNEVTQPTDEMLQSASLVEGAYTVIAVKMRERVDNLKLFMKFRSLSSELQKRLDSSIEEMNRAEEHARSDMRNFDNFKGVKAAAEVWTKLMDEHLKDTRTKIKEYNDVTRGRILGTLNDETKRTLGDAEFFKEEFSQMEADAKDMEAALDRLDKALEGWRDGDFKNKVKENFAKCREILKKCSAMRAEMKTFYESALSDAELK